MKNFYYIIFFLSIFLIPSISYSANINTAPSSGLVGYWSFNEGTSTIAHDLSGNSNHITSVGTPVWTFGKTGQSTFSTTSGAYFSRSITNSLNLSSQVSISVWVYPLDNQNPTHGGGVISVGNAVSNDGNYELAIISGNKAYFRNALTSTNNVTSNYTLPSNTWTHIVAVYNGATSNIYINGVLDISQANTGSLQTDSTVIRVLTRHNLAGGTARFIGRVDELRIYNRELSQSEINNLYVLGSSITKTAKKNGLISHWSLDDATSTIAINLANSRYNGTLVGFTNPPNSISGWTSSGKFGSALKFDGSDYVTTGTSILGGLDAMSYGVWFKTTNSSGNAIIGEWSGGAASAITISSNGIDVYNGRTPAGWNYGVVPVSARPSNNKWHHIFVTWGRTTNMSVYFDGVLSSTTASTNLAQSNGYIFKMGVAGNTSDLSFQNYYSGTLDDARVYNYQLSDSEVAALYKAKTVAVNKSQSNIITSGLQNYYTFNGPDISDKIYDTGSMKNHAYISGIATSSAMTMGKLGQAMVFDGVDDTVQTISNTGITGAQPRTITGWFKQSSALKRNVVGYGGAQANAQIFDIIVDGTIGKVYGHFYGSSNDTTVGAPSYSLNQWNHFAMTYDGTTVNFYLNGVYTNSKVITLNTVDSTLKIGSGAYTLYSYFNGSIDDIRLYSRALSATEIQNLYSVTR